MGAHFGSQRVGAVTVPVGTGNTKRQIQILRDFGCTAICCTPSYMIYIAETCEQMGIDMSEIKLERGFLGAEPWTPAMRDEIERRLHMKTYDIYGLTEVIGPGVAFECDERVGLHVNEDHFYPEILDPDTLQPLPDGELGELTFTCFTKQACPMIRYRTRDLCTISHEPCACGRTLARISKPVGRSDDTIAQDGLLGGILLVVEGITLVLLLVAVYPVNKFSLVLLRAVLHYRPVGLVHLAVCKHLVESRQCF